MSHDGKKAHWCRSNRRIDNHWSSGARGGISSSFGVTGEQRFASVVVFDDDGDILHVIHVEDRAGEILAIWEAKKEARKPATDTTPAVKGG